MLKHKTLFVVGAGASTDFGFPVGNELSKQIAAVLKRIPETGPSAVGRIGDALNAHAQLQGRSYVDFYKKAAEVGQALPQAISVDAYVENMCHDQEIAFLGKLGIAACLLDCEKGSPLFAGHRSERGQIDHECLSHTWLGKLFHILVEGHTLASLKTIFEKTVFMIFNYDRCIEQYFKLAIANYFRISAAEAHAIVQTCTIYHPYGSLGPILNEHGPTFGGFGPGGTTRPERLLRIANEELRTYSEYLADDLEIKATAATLNDCATLAFVGFAFHRQNVRLLKRVLPKGGSRVMATVYKVPEANLPIIRSDIASMLGIPAIGLTSTTLVNEKCADFIDNYRLLLSQR